MPASIRVLVQTCALDLDERVPSLIQRSQAARQEPGCLQFEYFRSADCPENLARLELWESPSAFEEHRARGVDGGAPFTDGDPRHVQAPFHHGAPDCPRRQGENGVEFYRLAYSVNVGGVWTPSDEANRVEPLRWPVPSGVRIIYQQTAEPGYVPPAAYLAETRAEPGCLQFETYRGIEFTENTIALELWASAAIYDQHYSHRNMQRLYGVGTLPQAGRNQPERRYGRSGMEIYPHCYFALVGGVWQPEDPALRMSTLRLP